MIPYYARFRLVLFITGALAVFWLSVMPDPPIPESGPLAWDKVQHALAYGFLMLLGGWAFLPLIPSRLSAWRRALIIVVVYGALMEGVQALLAPGRSGDPADMLANALGGIAVYGLVRLFYLRISGDKEKK